MPHVIRVSTENSDIKDELEFLFLNRKMLNLNRNAWTWFKNLCIYGDQFMEIVIDPEDPKRGIFRVVPLPPETMYRIETVKSKLIEFQQSKEGPDYQAIVRGSVTDMSDTELNQTTAIRFAPNQIIHFRIGDDRKTFYPYGQSLIEPARAPAHSLRLMEDAMVVYRLVRAAERRVFYIDVGQLPPFKNQMIERLQSSFEDGLTEIAERHLQLRGYPDESYRDLKIKMTPPSDWRELSRQEFDSN
jgi:hypothetical protein